MVKGNNNGLSLEEEEILESLSDIKHKLKIASENLEKIITSVKELNKQSRSDKDLQIAISANPDDPRLSKALDRLVSGK